MKKASFVGQKRLGRVGTFISLALVLLYLVGGAVYIIVFERSNVVLYEALSVAPFLAMAYYGLYGSKFYTVTDDELRVTRIWPWKKVYRLCDVTAVELVGDMVVINLKDGEGVTKLYPPLGKMSEYFIQLIKERAKLQ